MVRSAALRRCAFSLLKACSIGLRSGEEGPKLCVPQGLTESGHNRSRSKSIGSASDPCSDRRNQDLCRPARIAAFGDLEELAPQVALQRKATVILSAGSFL